jgi:hypothetical protein
MSKKLLIGLGLAALSLTGCVAVPYDSYYGGGYYAPAPAVVAPSVGFSYYSGPRRGYYHRHRY